MSTGGWGESRADLKCSGEERVKATHCTDTLHPVWSKPKPGVA
jgi:hypothetical protein